MCLRTRSIVCPMTAEELAERRNTWEEEVKQFEKEKKQYIRFFRPEIKIDHIEGRTRFVLSDSMKPKESSIWFDMYNDGKNPPIVERRKKGYEIYGVKK